MGKLFLPGSSTQERESREWEISQQSSKGTWFACWEIPVWQRGRKQQQGRRSHPKVGWRAADLKHILQWWHKEGKESVQVIDHSLPRSPLWVLFSLKSAWVKKTSRNTHHMCLYMFWAADKCPKIWNLAKRGSLFGWLSRFCCPEWSVIPYVKNVLKSLPYKSKKEMVLQCTQVMEV